MEGRKIGNGALAASRVVSAVPGKLLGLYGVNTNGSQQYIQLHEAGALPADGVVPLLSIPVPGGQFFSFDFPQGMPVDALTVCNSSAMATKNMGGADCSFVAIFA